MKGGREGGPAAGTSNDVLGDGTVGPGVDLVEDDEEEVEAGEEGVGEPHILLHGPGFVVLAVDGVGGGEDGAPGVQRGVDTGLEGRGRKEGGKKGRIEHSKAGGRPTKDGANASGKAVSMVQALLLTLLFLPVPACHSVPPDFGLLSEEDHPSSRVRVRRMTAIDPYLGDGHCLLLHHLVDGDLREGKEGARVSQRVSQGVSHHSNEIDYGNFRYETVPFLSPPTTQP